MKKGMIEASLYDLNANLIKRTYLRIPIPRQIKLNRPFYNEEDDSAEDHHITFSLEAWSTEFALYVTKEQLLLPEDTN